MSLQPLKLLFLFIAAAFEVSLLHLGGSLIAITAVGSTNLSWLMLLGVCLVAAWSTARFSNSEDDGGLLTRPWLLLLAVCTISYAVKVQAGGGLSVISGWGVLSPWASESQNLALGSPVLFFVCLLVWWRGMVILDHDHGSLLGVLQKGVLGLVLLSMIATLSSNVNLGEAPWGGVLALEAVLTIALGLFSLSLAGIIVQVERQGGAGGWHALRSSLFLAIVVLVVGMLLLSIFSDTATLAVRVAVSLVVGFIALLFAPLASLFFQLATWITNGRVVQFVPSGSSGMSELLEQEAPSDQTLQLMELLVSALNLMLYLAPLLALIVLILVTSRRRKVRVIADGELHESLWSWQAVGTDLLSLLNGLRSTPRTAGLRDALARLRADDPVQRIRRRYIQLLLLGEAAKQQRKPQQTPLEHEISLGTVVPAADTIHALTTVYDRARYAPNTISSADAETADNAWATIEAEATKENR